MPLLLAPLAAIVIAIVAVIALYAFYQLFHPLLQGIGSAGGTVGGFVARAAGSIISAAYGYAANWARGALHALLAFILAPVFWIERNFAQIIATLNSLTFALSWTDTYFIPHQLTGVLGQARTWISSLQNFTVSGLASQAAYALGLFRAAEQYTAAGLAQQAAYSLQLFHTAEQYTTAGLAAESAFVQQGLAGLEAYTAAGLAAQGRYALGLYGQSVAYTQALVGSQIGAIDKDLTGLENWTASQLGSLATALAASQTLSFAFARSLVGTVEGELDDLKKGCTDNLCSGVGDLAGLLNGLSGDLGLAGLFSLAAEFARDPKGAAAGVQQTLGPLAADAAGAVRSLIGL